MFAEVDALFDGVVLRLVLRFHDFGVVALFVVVDVGLL